MRNNAWNKLERGGIVQTWNQIEKLVLVLERQYQAKLNQIDPAFESQLFNAYDRDNLPLLKLIRSSLEVRTGVYL